MINQFKVIVSGFVFNSKNELLVIRRTDNEEAFPGMLAIPGGTVEAKDNKSLSMVISIIQFPTLLHSLLYLKKYL